jgi:hypothetical protein
MGTSGARNPTLTLQALAWRTADHLAKNWKVIVSVAMQSPRNAGKAALRYEAVSGTRFLAEILSGPADSPFS